VPLWLYLYGAAGAVLLSFVVFGLFVGERGAAHGYPRLNLLRFGFFRATMASRAFVSGLRLASVALFVLVILTGLLGDQTPVLNLAPTIVWVIWWVGFSLFVALAGNLWAIVNPLKVVFEWADGLVRRLGVDEGLESDAPYPASWDVWPALALFFVFVWVELVFPGSATPRNIAFFILLYCSVTWAGMSLFGKEAWLRKGEAFSVFFSILARFAPTEVRVKGGKACEECDACESESEDEDCVNCYGCFVRATPGERELNLRPPAVGLLRSGGTSGGRLAFMVFMLASVTYDGLLATPLWVSGMFYLQSVTGSFGVLGSLFYGTLGLVAVPLLFFGLYAGFVKLCQVMGGGASFWGLAGAFAYSLVPIALAYQAAHYYTLLILEGQNLFALASDPFGWGWDLFGTGGYEVKEGFLVTSPISDSFQILDVRNPLKPKVLGRGAHPQPESFLFHSGVWPRSGGDKFVMMQGEKNFKPRCDKGQGPVMSYRAIDVPNSNRYRFELLDRYRVENGAYANGDPAVNALGCSAHWFEVHPTWKDGGMLAAGYYEHGTHFLKVADDGEITRKGYFLPNAGSTSAAYWINRNVVYTVDYTRGIDILRYTGPGTDGPITGANQRGTGRG